MRLTYDKKKHDDINFAGISKVDIDNKKSGALKNIISTGIKNYTLFQKFSNFHWPAWIQTSIDDDSGSPGQFLPFLLVNNTMRESLSFSTFLSHDELLIDHSGMTSPSYAQWSVELWMASGNDVIRPCLNTKRVHLERDPGTSLISMTWDEKNFKLQQVIYGARSTVDEAILDVNLYVRDKARSNSLLLCIRPYNLDQTGGIESIRFNKDENSLTINGIKSISLAKKPDYFLSGSGEMNRDINVGAKNDAHESKCRYGMAVLAAGYNLKKGDNTFLFRISLTGDKDIPTGKFDLSGARDDYIAYAGSRIQKNVSVKLPDKVHERWFYGSKLSLLGFSYREIHSSPRSPVDMETAYFTICGYNRMGYFNESAKLIDYLKDKFTFDPKNITIETVIAICHLLNSIADYYIHLRDLDYLQSIYPYIKNSAMVLYGYTRKIKKVGGIGKNSIREYIIAEDHLYDYILMAFSLSQYSYLARCIGIFGDEIKINKELSRFTSVFSSQLWETDLNRQDNDFALYNVFAGYPFRLDAVPAENYRMLSKNIDNITGRGPLCIKSIGWDIFLTVVYANNLIYNGDMRGYEIIQSLLEMGNNYYVLPHYMNPSTGSSLRGRGASKIVSSMIFSTIRNLLFIDHPERLEIFPVPVAEWFKTGNEINIDSAPSRFGLISIRVVSTANEVQFHFEKLPKFIPPDILIHLPFKTKIKPEDDFIIKKEEDRSFVINGWPSIVRFSKK